MTRPSQFLWVPLIAVFLLAELHPSLSSAVEFDRVVIDSNFAGAHQVEVADVNGDARPDIVVIGEGTCAWYENPSWRKRIVTGPSQTPGIISSATADLDGDGKAEIAIAYDFVMNDPTRGKLLLAGQGKGLDDPWSVAHVADVGSIHRIRWYYQLITAPHSLGFRPVLPGRNAPARGETLGAISLLVAPLFGPSARPPAFDQEPAHLVTVSFHRPEKQELRPPIAASGGITGGLGGSALSSDRLAPLILGKWNRSESTIADASGLHAIDVVDVNGENNLDILAASHHGVTRHFITAIAGAPIYRTEHLVPGAQGDAPRKGASDVHIGRLKGGRRFLATVEPWQSPQVAVYFAESWSFHVKLGPRNVLDSSLKEGHGLWVADIDGDGDDEIFVGNGGTAMSILMFDFDGKAWNRSVVDSSIAVQDLRGGDIDGDHIPDVVAVGAQTHNVIWYKARAGSPSR